MAHQATNDTFISYRRDAGGTLALALWQSLTHQHHIDAFYDIESIRAGEFGSVVLGQIAARPYFVLVLCPGTLEHCVDANNWLRREIDQAIATKRVIVPAYTPNFDFADCDRFLPGELGPQVRGFQAQEVPHTLFKEAVQKLVEEYLRPVVLATTAAPANDQRVVDAIQQQAELAPTVTREQLSAQEYVERAYSRSSGDLVSKLADYSEAIRLDPQNAFAFTNRGTVYREKGNVARAIRDFSEAIRVEPENAFAFTNRGTARREQGDLQGALEDFSEAIRLEPNNAFAFTNRGTARRQQVEDDIDGAIEDFTEAIRIEPWNAFAFNNRGTARRDTGDLDGAIEDFSEAFRLEPENAFALNSRGAARRDKGDIEGARTDFTEANRLDPDLTLSFLV